MVFEFLLILLIYFDIAKANTETLIIGYLHRGSTDAFYTNYFTKLIDDNKNIISPSTITYQEFTVNNDLSNLNSILNTINETKNLLHVFTDDTIYDIADELSEYPCYFWMAYPLAQKRCSKNVIYYSSFVPMMISCIYNYLFFYYSWSSISHRFSKSKYCCLCCRR